MTKPRPPRLDLNPSSADRWTTCTASPQFILDNADKLPVSTDTPYNMEGTTAHEVAAAFLQERDVIEANCKSAVTPDMRWHGFNYSEYVSALRAKQSMLFVEQKMELWYMPGRHAIVDAAVLNPLDLHVIDYKYGEGVVVHPEGSLQAIIYANSIAKGHNLPDDFPVFIHIYQPRGRAAEDGAEHVWPTTWATIKEYARQISETATVIQGPRAQVEKYLAFAPSEKACRWCAAKGFCSARQAHITQDIEALAVIEAEPPKLPLASTLADEQIQAVLTHKSEIAKWLDDVEQHAFERMSAGHRLPGWKLVMSRGGNRQWSDPQKAVEVLVKDTILKRSDLVEENVIGPAAVEKLIGKNKFPAAVMDLIVKPPGSPCIAPESDKREAIGGALDEIEAL